MFERRHGLPLSLIEHCVNKFAVLQLGVQGVDHVGMKGYVSYSSHHHAVLYRKRYDFVTIYNETKGEEHTSGKSSRA